MNSSTLPVAIIGAGPVGHAAEGTASASCCTPPARQLVTLGVARKTTETCCG